RSDTITLALQDNPSGATLGGTVSAAAVAGVATFPAVTISAIGAGESLKASTTGLPSATTTAVEIKPAAATKLVVTTAPAASFVAGTSFNVVVKAEDNFGDVDPNFPNAAASLGNYSLVTLAQGRNRGRDLPAKGQDAWDGTRGGCYDH